MEVIELNVGGYHYATTKATLCKYDNSMLARMFSGDMAPGHYDSKGRYFIDRNGELFGTILCFLRAEPINIPSDLVKRKALAQEARFFQVGKRRACAECTTFCKLKCHYVCLENSSKCGCAVCSNAMSYWLHSQSRASACTAAG